MRRLPLLLLLLFFFQAAQAEEQKLSWAYEQQLVERVRSVFSHVGADKIERPICATPIFLEMKAHWDKLSGATKKTLQSYFERPSYNYDELTYDTPDGHFKIHYVIEGENAVFEPQVDGNFNGHPDWVDQAGEAFQYIWVKEINGLSYQPPPSDGWYPSQYDNGGDERYDVYFMNISSFYLGYTQGELFVSGQSGSATSHMVLDNDYLGVGTQHTQLEWLQVTAAHEFFHAIQMGYDGAEYEQGAQNIKPYWMEMSAVWMEEIVYDHINDYLDYLPEFFLFPWLSLKTYRDLSDLHAYGSCIWPIFLQERFEDTTIIRDIWEECAKVVGNNAIDYPDGKSATDIAIETRGSTFEEAFREFTVWNYFTGSRARTELYYSEGDLFPEVMVEGLHYHMAYPVTQRPSGPGHPQNLGSNYVVFVPDPQLTEGGLRIEFIGGGADFNVSAVGYKSFPHMPLVMPFIGVGKVYDWSSYNEVAMITAVVNRNPDTYFIYEYQASHDSSLTQGSTQFEDMILQNYPNPFVIETESDLTFFPFVLYSPSRIQVDIFTVSGEKVKTITPKRDLILSSGEYTEELVLREIRLYWDGTNERGEYVSSGIYTYLFRTDRVSEVKKVAVIR